MKIALVQMNPTIGDFHGNIERMQSFLEEASKQKCDIVIFPELSFIGYPPRDFLDRPAFVEDSIRCWPLLERMSSETDIICGAISKNNDLYGKPYFNSVLYFSSGKLRAQAHKQLLPFYDVFDEERYFEPGRKTVVVSVKGLRLGLTICEDIWNHEGILPRKFYPKDPVEDLKGLGVDMVINIAASPYFVGKMEKIMNPLLSRVASEIGAPVVYVNQVGGNDELIFQGCSMVYLADGSVAAKAASFKEDLIVFDLDKKTGEFRDRSAMEVEEVVEALCMGLRDYMRKCGFDKVVLGLSGGIDSSVAACIARLSLGKDRVLGVGLPGPYSSPESLEDAHELAKRLEIGWDVVSIRPLFNVACEALASLFEGLDPDITEENIQARLRGLVLMAISNKFGRLLLSTGNKSELAVGYCTLYGDMNGGLAILGDVPKTMVYRIGHYFRDKYGWIPERVLTKAPSAELKPNQTDQDTLPPYDVLDRILELYIEENMGEQEIVAQGFDADTVREVIFMVEKNEYKRRQAPPVLKVTSKAFGSGRRMPIAHGYRPWK